MSDKTRFINPYTDFGFKKLFGEEVNKDLLVDFLNQLLPQKHIIKELTFRNVENQSDVALDRKAIFDIHCISETDERFIVEMQKAKIKYFKDRSLFYTTFPIKEQAERGDWNFRLDPIYYIAILDFFYDEEQEKAKVKRAVQLKDQDCEVFFDKLNYVFLQMPAFNKEKDELKSHYDKWLYFLKHLEHLEDIPEILKEPVFEKAFKIAEIANFSTDEYDAYQKSLLTYRDMVNVMKTKYEEGIEQGIEQGIENVTIRCLKQGKDSSEISQITGLAIDQIEKIGKKMNDG